MYIGAPSLLTTFTFFWETQQQPGQRMKTKKSALPEEKNMNYHIYSFEKANENNGIIFFIHFHFYCLCIFLNLKKICTTT